MYSTCFRSGETDLIAIGGGAIVVTSNHEARVVGPWDKVRGHTGYDGYYDDSIQRVPNPVKRLVIRVIGRSYYYNNYYSECVPECSLTGECVLVHSNVSIIRRKP